MSDSTPQRRVLPARERRESAAKRRATSPGIQPVSTPNSTAATPSTEPRQKRKYTKRASLIKSEPTTSTSTSTPGAEDVLPTRVSLSKPLPTSRDQQPTDLSNREFQSLADSAILAASLFRSRAQWLQEGIFKRYWVKPTKRKGVIEQPPGNPDIKSMHKLGNATITIEPHTFDATFYVVREMAMMPLQPLTHAKQHTAKAMNPSGSGVDPSPARLSATSTSQASIERQSSTPVKQEEECKIKPEVSTITAPGASSLPPQAPPPTPAPSGPPRPSDDPVIQMLAARAASDSRLKAIMKVVAGSEATPAELREFQSHIDEFNAIVKQRELRASLEARNKPPATQPSPVASRPGPSSSKMPPPPAVGPAATGPPGAAYPQPLARPEAIIKHVIIEFHSSVSSAQGPSADRWLFPEHAVLELRAGGMEMVASFFVERNGKDILKATGVDEERDGGSRSKFKSGKGYFQPVTMLIKATQHRTIETIARAARPLVDVQSHMKAVMKDNTRAPVEYLIHRLPRDKIFPDPSMIDFADSGIDIGEGEDDELKDYYGI